VLIALSPATAHTPNARLRVEQPAVVDGVGTFAPTDGLPVERGAYVITLSDTITEVVLELR